MPGKSRGASRGPLSALKLPPNVRVLAGGAGAIDDRPADSAVSRVSLTAPVKPDKLPPLVSDAWDEIVPELDAAGMLSPVDGPTLELALRHYAAAVKASNALLRGAVVKHDDKNERDMKNPASQVFRDHSTAFLEYAKQLGLSFAARTRLPGRDDDADTDSNPFAVGG